MTLRVMFDIIPHGVKEAEYNIHTLLIHNVGRVGEPGLYNYVWEFLNEKDEVVQKGEVVGFQRDLGAPELVRRALVELTKT